jgi:hypothetical protein
VVTLASVDAAPERFVGTMTEKLMTYPRPRACRVGYAGRAPDRDERRAEQLPLLVDCAGIVNSVPFKMRMK